MKKLLSIILAVFLLLSSTFSALASAGEGNMTGGGGGMGAGTNDSYWNQGNAGVRVTVVRVSDNAPVTTPIDYSNKNPKISAHFSLISKIGYRTQPLSLKTSAYTVIKPKISLPTIISPTGGSGHIPALKKYFCSEYALKMIAEDTGMDYDVLIGGQYKLLIEPVAYFTFYGLNIAATAHEAALYNQVSGGALGEDMANLTHKNLPLSIRLEIPDLGFSLWDGTVNAYGYVSNEQILSSLGLGIVWFKEPPTQPPVIDDYDYEYRTDTEVITSVTVSGGQADPDRPVTVRFVIDGRTHTVSNVYYPSGDSQLVWVRWRTPAEPQTMTIHVTASGGTPSKATITAKIVDLSENEPPNPVADDRNDSFSPATVPTRPVVTSLNWGVWRPYWYPVWIWHSGDDDERGYWCDHGYWKFTYDRYSASLTATMTVNPDDKAPTATGRRMKSGYGIKQSVTSNVSTNQSSATTPAQNAVTYFPEFRYEDYWRLLEQSGTGGFEFKENEYSTYKRNVHFSPIWYPDGAYTPNTWIIDSWTPAGMLSLSLTDTVTIAGSLWDDWHIAPQKPQ